jgi:crossover junction endodeoxyribonuclease RuvC
MNRRLEVYEYTPTRIKQSVVGSGRAEKEQVQHMVQVILKLTEKPVADAADALAVALSHAHTGATQGYMANLSRGGRVL